MRYDTYSLKRLLNELSDRFPGISEIYLFGSRLHKTRSTRSDVDLLVTVDESILGEDVRDFALQECPALDFFLIDQGVSTSCANGSKVRARNKKELVQRLGAVKIWEKSTGFQQVDIDWDFNVIKGMNPMMTTLVSLEPFPSKAEAVSPNTPEETLAAPPPGWNSIQSHPIWVIAIVACAVAVATFTATYQMRIVPLEREITNLKEEVSKLNTVSPSNDETKAQTTK